MAWTAQLIPADSPPPSPPCNVPPPPTPGPSPPAPRQPPATTTQLLSTEAACSSSVSCLLPPGPRALFGARSSLVLPPGPGLTCSVRPVSLSICCLFPPESSGFLHWPRGLARAPVTLWVPFPHCAALAGLEWSAFVTGWEGGGSLPSSVTPPGAEDRVLLISGSPEARVGSDRQ